MVCEPFADSTAHVCSPVYAYMHSVRMCVPAFMKVCEWPTVTINSSILLFMAYVLTSWVLTGLQFQHLCRGITTFNEEHDHSIFFKLHSYQNCNNLKKSHLTQINAILKQFYPSLRTLKHIYQNVGTRATIIVIQIEPLVPLL